jgi:hypothetical protein
MRHTVYLLLAFAAAGFGRGVRVEFDPSRQDIGPFPNNTFTTADDRQRTGLRVALPMTGCSARPSDCAEIGEINELDGFGTTPRITVRFSGAIQPETLRENVYVAWLDPALTGRYNLYPAGKLTTVNELVWDPSTFTAYVKPDEMLEQSRTYLILVTDGVKDAAGDPVEASATFGNCAAGRGSAYCASLSRSMARVSAPGRVVAASEFTTASVTAFLEAARVVVRNTPTRFRTTGAAIQLASVRSLTERQHVRAAGNRFNDFVLPLPGALLAQSGAGRIAFGSFRSPRFIDDRTLTIPQTGSAQAVEARGEEEIHFHAWLPRVPMPAGGYPVIIAGHGITDSKFGMPTWVATATGAGVAVVAINARGHGYGPETVYRLTMNDGSVAEAPAPGRTLDVDGDGVYGPAEGCIAPSPRLTLILGDCVRQTSVDLLQLAHTIRDGIDFDGDGNRELNGEAVYYIGQSLGGAYGAMFSALEPNLRAAVFNVPPGSLAETLRTTARTDLKALFALSIGSLRQPSLLNDGAGFADQLPLRNAPVSIRERAGATGLQDFFERMQWLGNVREPQHFAPYLKAATLPEVFVRPILLQMAYGDLQIPNQNTSAFGRAGFLHDSTSLYRHDWARAAVPALSIDAHTYLLPLGPPEAGLIATTALNEAVQFLLGGRYAIPNVNPMVRGLFGRDLFTQPEFLPEEPNFPAR